LVVSRAQRNDFGKNMMSDKFKILSMFYAMISFVLSLGDVLIDDYLSKLIFSPGNHEINQHKSTYLPSFIQT
jgi:hypothetical protein